MLLLPSPSITISPNRQRREFDELKLQELATSIASNGLLQPIVVRSIAGGHQLVCGERRLRAMQNLRFLGKVIRFAGEPLPGDLVPCIPLGDLDLLAAWEAELDENIKRTDLTWQERAAATSQLSALRGAQAVSRGEEAPKPADIARELYPQAAAKTGAELGTYRENVRRDLILAQHLEEPEVKGAKTADEAFKALKRKEEVRKNTELAATVGATFTSAVHSAHNVDCIAWMASCPPETFDVVLTDPPYGMGADKFGDSGGRAAGAHEYEDSYENWQKLMPAFARLAYRVTKPQAHLYAFCDFDHFHELRGLLEEEGWQVFRTPIIWVKPGGNRLPWVDFGPQRKFELCLYANKGRKPVTRIFPDVVSFNPDDNLGWAAQKPVQLFVDLLKRSVAPGNKVLDPFAGSGTIFPAAQELKVEATGLEQLPAGYGICLKRLEQLRAQGELPLSTSLTDLSGLK